MPLFDRIAERAIREAMRDGKFDNLPNAGQPLDLDDYFKAPEELRAAYGLLKSANVAPEEVDLLREIDRLHDALDRAPDAEAAAVLRRQMHQKQLRLDLALERRRRK